MRRVAADHAATTGFRTNRQGVHVSAALIVAVFGVLHTGIATRARILPDVATLNGRAG